jgi:hypothetical protein
VNVLRSGAFRVILPYVELRIKIKRGVLICYEDYSLVSVPKAMIERAGISAVE